jgi:ankyrin repeat protein
VIPDLFADTLSAVGWNHGTRGGHTELVRLLVEKGADVNPPGMFFFILEFQFRDTRVVDKDGWTPLHCAAQGDHTELVHYLVEKGADFNTPGMFFCLGIPVSDC